MKTKEVSREKAQDTAPSPPPEKILYDNRIKRKNVLALNEKVAAIREYEKMPVYKRIGRMFHCSPDQIKRIVQQKETILKAWEQRTRRCQDAKTLEMKVVRVSMLGKAVYEWIRRMMYYKDLMIKDGLIQKMALQFKSAMGLQNFFPHQEWCDKFRQTYKIHKFDSKLLKIGYTQGYSVQIKDIIKDILSECTPDVADTNIDGNEDDEEGLMSIENVTIKPLEHRNGATEKKLTLKTSQGAAPQPNNVPLLPRAMPQLQPIRQLVALPFKTNGIPGMPQKVLVATPITPPVGTATTPRSGTTPMTMTIIPLATIAQPKQQAAMATSPTAAVEKQPTMPPPMLTIKQEVKDESEDVVSAVKIKQEVISDEEMDEEPVEPSSSKQQAMSTMSKPASIVERTSIERELSKEKRESVEDYDDLALSSLRKLMQTQVSPNTNARSSEKLSTAANEIVSANLHGIVESAAITVIPLPKSMPPLPPLTRAPTLNRTASRRMHTMSSTPMMPAIKSCGEARKYLKLLEDFALAKENFRLIGLITRADEVLRELDGNDDVDVD